mmetsp:Transcript_11854/g.39004  ORF Transcript_11854/g.39004 Transcript_11854/m.39004 type:complete len:303 (-) Transcript_11854:1790-2698(-)
MRAGRARVTRRALWAAAVPGASHPPPRATAVRTRVSLRIARVAVALPALLRRGPRAGRLATAPTRASRGWPRAALTRACPRRAACRTAARSKCPCRNRRNRGPTRQRQRRRRFGQPRPRLGARRRSRRCSGCTSSPGSGCRASAPRTASRRARGRPPSSSRLPRLSRTSRSARPRPARCRSRGPCSRWARSCSAPAASCGSFCRSRSQRTPRSRSTSAAPRGSAPCAARSPSPAQPSSNGANGPRRAPTSFRRTCAGSWRSCRLTPRRTALRTRARWWRRLSGSRSRRSSSSLSVSRSRPVP